MVLRSNPSVILLCSFLPSDYIIEEKTAVLQKREHEGFGFVLRGAKGKEGAAGCGVGAGGGRGAALGGRAALSAPLSVRRARLQPCVARGLRAARCARRAAAAVSAVALRSLLFYA